MSDEQEAEIFFPEPEKVKVADREYEIHPLKLRQLRLLLKLSKLDLSSINDDTVSSLTSGISEILGEKDLVFLEDNLDIPLVKAIFQKVRKVTYTGIPENVGGAKKGN